MAKDVPTLSLRKALAQDRLEEFVRAAEARGVELSKGSEFERGLALLLVQREGHALALTSAPDKP